MQQVVFQGPVLWDDRFKGPGPEFWFILHYKAPERSPIWGPYLSKEQAEAVSKEIERQISVVLLSPSQPRGTAPRKESALCRQVNLK